MPQVPLTALTPTCGQEPLFAPEKRRQHFKDNVLLLLCRNESHLQGLYVPLKSILQKNTDTNGLIPRPKVD